MIDEFLIKSFLEWKVKKETVRAKKMVLGDREIHPIYIISIFYKGSQEIAFTSISPIAWIINDCGDSNVLTDTDKEFNENSDKKTSYYGILFDENEKELFDGALARFEESINFEDPIN